MKKKNFAKFEMVCYVVAAVLLVAAVYMLIANVSYINEYLAVYGMSFMDLGGQGVQTIITAVVPYFVYAFLTFAAGMIYGQVAAPKCVCVEETVEASAEAVGEEAVKVVWAETPATVMAEEEK